MAPRAVCFTAGQGEVLPVLAGEIPVKERRVPRNLAVFWVHMTCLIYQLEWVFFLFYFILF